MAEFSWLTALGFLFLTFNSGMAIYRSNGDKGSVIFVVVSYIDLLALFLCLRYYELLVEDDESDTNVQCEMEASSKITAAVAASSYAGLVGMLFGVYKRTGGGGSTQDNGVHVAIMFMFSTAVLSMLSMMVSMKVLEIRNNDLRRSMVALVRHANTALLCLLAIRCYVVALWAHSS